MGISPSADGDNGLPPLDPDKPFEKGLTENFSVLVRQLWWGIEQLRRLARKRKNLNNSPREFQNNSADARRRGIPRALLCLR